MKETMTIGGKKRLLLLTVLFLFGTIHPAYGHSDQDLAPGMSCIAEDQGKASARHQDTGLEITWLDFGDDLTEISGQSANEGMFVIHGQTKDKKSVSFVIDKNGTILYGPTEHKIGTFSEGMAEIRGTIDNQTVAGFIDADGKEVIPIGTLEGYGYENGPFSEGLAAVFQTTNGRVQFGYIDKTGREVIPPQYAFAAPFHEGLAVVADFSTGKKGYIDPSGKIVIPLHYENASNFSEGSAFVETGGTCKVIDRSGNIILTDPDWQYVDSTFSGGLAIIQSKSTASFGFIDQTGMYAIPPSFSSGGNFAEGVAVVEGNVTEKGRTRYLINRQGQPVTAPENDALLYEGMQEGLVLAWDSSTSKYCMIDASGTTIIPPAFFSMTPFSQGISFVVPEQGKTIAGLLKKPSSVDTSTKEKPIQVLINGKAVDFQGVTPIIRNGRTLVPMRDIFENLGAVVDWNQETKTVTGTKDTLSIRLTIGESTAVINGATVILDVPAEIDQGNTLVPLRFIAESFSAEVLWEKETRTILIQ